MKQLIQIVPNLPPQVSGVGDYALQLASELRSCHGIETSFLVGNPSWSGPDEVQGFKVALLDRIHCKVGLADKDHAGVLLHYVGYGYSKRGAPLWLLGWLRTLLRASPRPKLVTFFHELYAFGPPWRSSFWLAPLQRFVCRELARLSDTRLTNRADSAKILRQMAKAEAFSLPIFSSLGEPQEMPKLAQRQPQMVVYGGLSRLPHDAEFARTQLSELCVNLGIKRVVSFGKASIAPFAVDLPIENRGVLSVEEIGALLLQSRAGYIDYPMFCLAKSSIFAAYCAHGVLPVLLRSGCAEAEGLREGEHLLTAENSACATDAHLRQQIASACRIWYQTHCVAEIAQFIVRRLTTP